MDDNWSWKLVQKGKVRDIYEHIDGAHIALVASDRVSASDRILPVEIEDKGKILTEISAFWFERTEGILQGLSSTFITTDAESVSPFFQRPEFEGRTTIMQKVKMLPVEAIVRGYITGSLWRAYKNGAREFCELSLPNGLHNCDRMQPLFTPTTKAPQGEHDENISFWDMVELFRREGYDGPRSLADKVREYSLELYDFAYTYAAVRGVILADTKLEFGLDERGRLCVADELFTPDSSRFWLRDDYAPGREQRSMDKQIIRDYVNEHKHENPINIPEEILMRTKAQYEKCLKLLTS